MYPQCHFKCDIIKNVTCFALTTSCSHPPTPSLYPTAPGHAAWTVPPGSDLWRTCVVAHKKLFAHNLYTYVGAGRLKWRGGGGWGRDLWGVSVCMTITEIEFLISSAGSAGFPKMPTMRACDTKLLYAKRWGVCESVCVWESVCVGW